MKITDVILQEDTDYEKYIRQNLAAMAKDAHKKDYWGVNEILSHVLNYKGDPDQEIMRQSQNLDLLNTYKAAIIKSLLIVIKMPEDEFDEYEYDFNNVINFLKSNLKWPEIDVITKAIAYNNEKKSVNESEESEELVAEFMGYIDQKNYWEAFNCLISAYDADRDCLQSWWSALDDEKPAIMKGLLHVIKNESDLPVESIIDDMYADLQWPELVTVKKAMMYNKQQKAVPEAYDPDSDPVIGYVHDMYKDLSDGAADLTVLNLRDYIYDTGSPENLARSIKEIEPRLPALIEKNKHGMVRYMLQIVKQDYEYATKALLPVFEVLDNLGIHWPECDRIAAALSQGVKKESVSEDAEQIPAAEILKYVKHIHPEGEFNIDYVITDHPYWTEADVPVSSLHIFDPEQDDIYDPYNRVQDTDLYHVDRLIPNIAAILQNKPLVIDDAGYILDGNHRALAAQKAGLKTVPVYLPMKKISEVKQRLDAKCWTGKHKAGTKIKNGVRVNNCVPNESVAEAWSKKYKRSINCSHPRGFSQKAHCAGRKKKANEQQAQTCPHCGGIMYEASMMTEKKDACYYKVKSRYKVWPSAYASGALVKCRKKGAKNWGSKSESAELPENEYMSEDLRKWFKEKWVRFGPDGKIRGDCARGSDKEGKPKCLPQSKAHSLGKKGRASAASRKRRQDPDAERSGKAINVKTKKESVAEDLSVSNAPRVPAFVQHMDKKLSDNLRSVFTFVIELNSEPRMSDPDFRSQVLAVFDKHKPEILRYMLHYIKHSDSDNVKWLTPGLIKIGIDWPELKTIDQALNAKRPDRAVTENDYRFSDVHQKKAEEDADRMNDSLEELGKHIAAGGKISVRETTSFWDVIYDINVFSKYRLAVLQPVLEHHKKTIVYMMLYILKHHHDDINEPMDEIFTSLRHARINWPELKTIQQALAQGSKTQSVSEADDYGKFKTISDMIARDFAEHPVRGFYMMLYWLNETKLTVADMPEIKPQIDQVKPDVIRALLQSVKADNDGMNISNALQILDRMQNCGVDWPEIDKIRQGLQHGTQQPSESILEDDDFDTLEMVKQKLASVGRKFNRFDENLEVWISNGFPQIRAFAFPTKERIYQITFVYNLKSIENYTVPTGFTPKSLKRMSKKVLESLVNPHSVIENLLMVLKEHSTDPSCLKQMQKDVSKLKTKFDWPELDTILKALNYLLEQNKTKMSEGIDEIESDRLKSFVKQIQQPLATKTGWLAAVTLEDLASVAISKMYGDKRFTDQDYAEAAAVLNLNNHKDVLIKGILENIKQNIANGNSTTWLAENVAMQKQILIKLGCNWPEMDRIAAAVAHNAN